MQGDEEGEYDEDADPDFQPGVSSSQYLIYGNHNSI
jgi:hypothetical protein